MSSVGGHHLPRLAKISAPSLLGQPVAVGLAVVGVDEHARAHVRHVGMQEAVRDRDMQDAVLAFQALDLSTNERIGSTVVGKNSHMRGS